MKCPACNFVCSELRDVCPKCVCDLRPFKRSSGLPITNAAAPYDELLKKVRPKGPPLKASEVSTHKGAVTEETRNGGTPSFSGVLSSFGLSSLGQFFKRPAVSKKKEEEEDERIHITIQELPEHTTTNQAEIAESSEPPTSETVADVEPTKTDLAVSDDAPLLLAEPTRDANTEVEPLTEHATAYEELALQEEEFPNTIPAHADGAPIEKILTELEFSPGEIPDVTLPASQGIQASAEVETPALLSEEATVFLLTNDNFPSLGYSTGPSLAWVVLSAPEDTSSAAALSENDDSLPFELVADRDQESETDELTPPSETPEHSSSDETVELHSDTDASMGDSRVVSEMHEESIPALGVEDIARELFAVELNLQSATTESSPTTALLESTCDSLTETDAPPPSVATELSTLVDPAAAPFPLLPPEAHPPADSFGVEDTLNESLVSNLSLNEADELQEANSEVTSIPDPSTFTATSSFETPDAIPVATEVASPVSERVTRVESLAFTPLERTGDIDEIERSFGDTFIALRSEFNSADIDPSAFLQLDRVEQEQVELLFSLASDELDGINPDAAFTEVSQSADTEVENSGLQQELNKVEQFIDEADAPASLKDVFSSQAGKRTRTDSNEPAIQTAPVWRRLVATFLDMVLVLILCTAFASLIDEEGGLASIVADISVNGIQDRHTVLVIAGLSVFPLCATLYYAICFWTLGASLSSRIFSLSLMTEAGRPLKLRHVFVRSFSMPLALAVGGYVPVLFGRRALPDVLARTRVVLDLE